LFFPHSFLITFVFSTFVSHYFCFFHIHFHSIASPNFNQLPIMSCSTFYSLANFKHPVLIGL
jgi:hypothetical protein